MKLIIAITANINEGLGIQPIYLNLKEVSSLNREDSKDNQTDFTNCRKTTMSKSFKQVLIDIVGRDLKTRDLNPPHQSVTKGIQYITERAIAT